MTLSRPQLDWGQVVESNCFNCVVWEWYRRQIAELFVCAYALTPTTMSGRCAFFLVTSSN